MPPAPSFEVEPVRATRTFEAAIEHLTEAIERAGLRTGDRLPNEGALAEQLGISKPTLRQNVPSRAPLCVSISTSSQPIARAA